MLVGLEFPEKLGGKCLVYSEIDKHAIDVYKNNFDTENEIFLEILPRLNHHQKLI